MGLQLDPDELREAAYTIVFSAISVWDYMAGRSLSASAPSTSITLKTTSIHIRQALKALETVSLTFCNCVTLELRLVTEGKVTAQAALTEAQATWQLVGILAEVMICQVANMPLTAAEVILFSGIICNTAPGRTSNYS